MRINRCMAAYYRIPLICPIFRCISAVGLLPILADRENSTTHLRTEVAHTLTARPTKKVTKLLLNLLQDPNEDQNLRQVIADDLESFGNLLPFDVLITTVADQDIGISVAAMKAMRSHPALIPIDLLLAYSTHPVWYMREVVVQTLMATRERVPIEPIIAALSDPEPRVRAAASTGCIHLSEWFGSRVPLVAHSCGASCRSAH